MEGAVKIDIFRGQTKAPRNGGPKPEPSDSGSGLEARSSFNERAMSFTMK